MKPARRPSSRRLLFDRRYGWIYDEWKDPSEEALAGGRGMFCVVPIAKALLTAASRSINFATASAAKALENPNQFSPQALQANLNSQFQKLMHSMEGPKLKLLTFKRDPSAQSTHMV